MSKRTLFLIFALFVITFVLLMIALYNPSAIPNLPVQLPTAPKQAVEQSTLTLGNPTVDASSSPSNFTYSVPINISTGKNKVTAVQLELQYDPEVLTSVSVTPGAFFKDPVVLLNQIDAKTGRISYAFGINLSPTEEGVMGENIVANITFKTKSITPQETSIEFLPKTLITAEGITESVLKESISQPFVVGSGQ